MGNNIKEKAYFLWSVADLLSVNYMKTNDSAIIIPLTVLKRMDLILENNKKKVFGTYQSNKTNPIEIPSFEQGSIGIIKNF